MIHAMNFLNGYMNSPIYVNSAQHTYSQRDDEVYVIVESRVEVVASP